MSNTSRFEPDSVVLRLAYDQDQPALRRLAERDSTWVPGGPLLVAEQQGVVLAAWSEAERRAIADPFHPTGHLVELLRAHATPARTAPAQPADRSRGLARRAARPV